MLIITYRIMDARFEIRDARKGLGYSLRVRERVTRDTRLVFTDVHGYFLLFCTGILMSIDTCLTTRYYLIFPAVCFVGFRVFPKEIRVARSPVYATIVLPILSDTFPVRYVSACSPIPMR